MSKLFVATQTKRGTLRMERVEYGQAVLCQAYIAVCFSANLELLKRQVLEFPCFGGIRQLAECDLNLVKENVLHDIEESAGAFVQ